MIKISKNERNFLEDVGLIRYRKTNKNGIITQDANLVVCNKEHVGKNAKTYYVVETFEILAFLGKFSEINVQKITATQLDILKNKGYATDKNIQTWGTYIPGALVYQDADGQYYVRKIAKILLDSGIWSNSRSKKEKILSSYESKDNFEDVDSEEISMENLFFKG